MRLSNDAAVFVCGGGGGGGLASIRWVGGGAATPNRAVLREAACSIVSWCGFTNVVHYCCTLVCPLVFANCTDLLPAIRRNKTKQWQQQHCATFFNLYLSGDTRV